MLKIIIILLLVCSCASTNMKKIGNKSYTPLDKNAPVQVFTEIHPALNYEKVCEISVRDITSSLMLTAVS